MEPNLREMLVLLLLVLLLVVVIASTNDVFSHPYTYSPSPTRNLPPLHVFSLPYT